jgi:hypothetical protein
VGCYYKGAQKMVRISLPLMIAIWVVMAGRPCWAEESDLQSLLNAKSLRCTLGPGALADWTHGTPEKPQVDTANFAMDPVERTVTFDAIDTKAQRARLIGNIGVNDVAVLASGVGLTFFYQAPYGGAVFATVYASKVATQYVFVYSVHAEILGIPRPSQYYGTCKILIS